MADITMCSGIGCSISHKCYRHNAKRDIQFQSYFITPPYKDGQCEAFWRMTEDIETLKEIKNKTYKRFYGGK